MLSDDRILFRLIVRIPLTRQTPLKIVTRMRFGLYRTDTTSLVPLLCRASETLAAD